MHQSPTETQVMGFLSNLNQTKEGPKFETKVTVLKCEAWQKGILAHQYKVATLATKRQMFILK